MKHANYVAVFLMLCCALPGKADPIYVLSHDGLGVIHLEPGSGAPISASTFDQGLLPPGYTATAVTGNKITINTLNPLDYMGFLPPTFYDGGQLQVQNSVSGSNTGWIQVITTNQPLAGNTTVVLDSDGKSFLLDQGSNSFYDFSSREPSTLTQDGAIQWDAKLYPVMIDGKELTIEDGISWGWTMQYAPIGTTSATFVDPTLDPSAVVSGVGTSSFAWGDNDPSTLTFTGSNFSAIPCNALGNLFSACDPFKLGTVTFHNGSHTPGTEASAVDLDLSPMFQNIPELHQDFTTGLSLVNTPNTDDPIASADYVTLNGYLGVSGYDYQFNVEEGATAQADLYGVLLDDLTYDQTTAVGSSDLLSLPDGAAFQQSYRLAIVGFGDSTSGGFTTGPTGGSGATSVTPEIPTLPLVTSGLVFAWWLGKRRARVIA